MARRTADKKTDAGLYARHDISLREALWCATCDTVASAEHICSAPVCDATDRSEGTTMTALVGLMVVLAATSACFGTPPKPGVTEVVVIVAVLDPSDSDRDPVEVRCAEVGAFVERAIAHARHADILVLATGSVVEPVVVVGWRRYNQPKRVAYEGASDRGDSARREFVAKLANDCRSAIRATHNSPVWAGVLRGASAIHRRCDELTRGRERCADGGRYLFVGSDLLETHEPGLAGRLGTVRRSKKQKPARAMAPLPEPIDLTGIHATFCGLSGTDASPRSNVELVERSWCEVLVGDDIILAPVCERLPEVAP